MRGKIPCNTHANREATTGCALCGTRLCAACAVSMNAIDYCESCAPASAIRDAHDEDYENIAVLDTEKVSLAGFDSRFMAAVVDGAILLAGVGVVVLGIVAVHRGQFGVHQFGENATGRVLPTPLFWCYSPCRCTYSCRSR